MLRLLVRTTCMSCRGTNLSVKLLRHSTTKMAHSHDLGGDSPRLNGWDKVPRPFLIGVAGGTASGKVCLLNKVDFLYYACRDCLFISN